MHAYLQSYASAASLPARALAECTALYHTAAGLRPNATAAAPAGAAAGAQADLAAAEAHLAFLEAAAALAHGQFTQFDMAFVWAGCAAAGAVLFWQLRLCVRQLGWPTVLRRSSSSGGWLEACLRPSNMLVLFMAGHSLALFSVGALMGEGRLQCYLIAALTLLVARAALRATLGLRAADAAAASAQLQLDSAAAAANGASATICAPAAASNGAGCTPAACILCECRVQLRNGSKPTLAPPAGALAGAAKKPAPGGATPNAATAAGSKSISSAGASNHRVVVVVALAAALLGINAALQALGLIDRSGQDPHDKSEPTTELLGAAAAAAGDVRGAAAARALAGVLAPLAAQAVLLAWVDRWLQLQAGAPAAGPLAGAGGSSLQHSRQRSWLVAGSAAAAAVQLAGIAAWWAAQLAGQGEASLADAWQAAMGLAGMGSSTAGSGEAGVLALVSLGAWQLPLRLLLPRVVYALALATLVVHASAAAARAWCPAPQARPPGDGASERVARMQQYEPKQLAESCRALLWLLACLLAPVVMVLGHKGPALGCLAVAQSVALVALLGQLAGAEAAAGVGGTHAGRTPVAAAELVSGSASQAASEGAQAASGGAQGAGGRAQAARVRGPHSSEPGFPLGLGCGFWSMYALQLFFCSGHFCEFSGLQYNASFIGFDDVQWAAATTLLVVNTFGLTALQLLALPLLCTAAELLPLPRRPDGCVPRESGTVGCCCSAPAAGSTACTDDAAQRWCAVLARAVLIASTIRFAALGVCIVSAAYQARHILLWAIFAPKLVFEVALMGVADVAVLLGAALWCA